MESFQCVIKQSLASRSSYIGINTTKLRRIGNCWIYQYEIVIRIYQTVPEPTYKAYCNFLNPAWRFIEPANLCYFLDKRKEKSKGQYLWGLTNCDLVYYDSKKVPGTFITFTRDFNLWCQLVAIVIYCNMSIRYLHTRRFHVLTQAVGEICLR